WPFRGGPNRPPPPPPPPPGPDGRPPDERRPGPPPAPPPGPPPGPDDGPPGERRPGPPPGPMDFEHVVVGGKPPRHGFFTHLPHPEDGSTASVSYRLGGHYSTFVAYVTLNDGPQRSPTPITFSVYGDGRLLWRSEPVSTRQ